MASTSRHPPRSWVALLTIMLLVAGCAGPVPTASPGPTATPLPTASPTLAPTPLAPATPMVVATPTPVPLSKPPSAVIVAAVSTLGRGPAAGFDRSTKIPALGQFVTWRFDGGVATAGRALQVQSLTSSNPAVWTTIGSVVADARGVATYQATFDHPAYLSLRVYAPAQGALPRAVSSGPQASWRGTGPCPAVVMSPGPLKLEGEEVTSPDGTTYRVDREWDAAGNWQSTLGAVHPSGGGPGWRYVFPACLDVDFAPVLDAVGVAYVVAGHQRAGVADFAVYTFDAHGRASAQPYRLPGGCTGIARAPGGVVYAWGMDVARHADGSPVAIRSSYLVALDASGYPAPGWPYGVTGPMSDPAFGTDGTAYVVTGYVGGWRALVAPASRRNLVVALRPDGRPWGGWPYEFAADVAPLPPGVGEGEIPPSQPPVVGPDGTIYVTAGQVGGVASPDLVYAFAAGGSLKRGWPYATRLADGSLGVEATGYSPGALPPVPSRGVAYLAERVGSGIAVRDEIAALGTDGRSLPGWPYSLAGGQGVGGSACWRTPASVRFPAAGLVFGQTECWLGFAPDGTLVFDVLAQGTPRPSCLRPEGGAVDCPSTG